MDFAKARSAQTNGITMEFFEQGEGSAVLLLHGFPELPFSWRLQADAVAEAGFRVIIPSQRGYGGTDAPSGPYDVKTLVADLTGLLDHLEVADAVWFGHDFGAQPAWFSAHFAPDRVLGMGSLCVPYPLVQGDLELVELLDKLRGTRNYMRAFQEPGAAESVLERDVEKVFRAILRGRGYTLEQLEAEPAEVRELPIGLWVGDPQLFGESIVSDEELHHYVETFQRTGFTGALSWYRALHEDHLLTKDLDPRIDKPALMVYAADDIFSPRGMGAQMPGWLPQLEEHTIPDAGHWAQQEKPEEFNAILISWLQRNFA